MDQITSSLSYQSSTGNPVNLQFIEILDMLHDILRIERNTSHHRDDQTCDHINTWIKHVTFMRTFVENDRLEYCLKYIVDQKLSDDSIIQCFQGGQTNLETISHASTLLNRFCAQTYQYIAESFLYPDL